MDIVTALETFNSTSEPKIGIRGTFRDGHTEATLPRMGVTIIIGAGMGKKRVSAKDIALLCQEAKRAADPGLTLLSAALDALSEIAEDKPNSA
jgi:hypothetical protein